MHIPVIKVGNSKGIRLNKILLKKYNISDSVELILEPDCIIIRPIKKARQGWEAAFRSMREQEDDQLLIPDVFEDENLDN